MRGRLAIFATEAGLELGTRICSALNEVVEERYRELTDKRALDQEGEDELHILRRMRTSGSIKLEERTITKWTDGEFKIKFSRSVRGVDAYVVNCPYEPPTPAADIINSIIPLVRNGAAEDAEQALRILEAWKGERSISENVFQELVFHGALRQLRAAHTTSVCPYKPFARQDHRRDREVVTAAVLARLEKEIGIESVVIVDTHSKQHALAYLSQDMGFENIYPTGLFLKNGHEDGDVVRISPDVGGAARARYYAKKEGVPVAIGDKRREYTNDPGVKGVLIMGEVKGRIKKVTDDMIATGGSIAAVVEEAYKMDPESRPVVIDATHGIFNGTAIDTIDGLHKAGKIAKVRVTDSIIRSPAFKAAHPWYEEISIAPLCARMILANHTDTSFGDIYLEKS
jgi:ribose-phosphate pyrophosphokinase